MDKNGTETRLRKRTVDGGAIVMRLPKTQASYYVVGGVVKHAGPHGSHLKRPSGTGFVCCGGGGHVGKGQRGGNVGATRVATEPPLCTDCTIRLSSSGLSATSDGAAAEPCVGIAESRLEHDAKTYKQLSPSTESFDTKPARAPLPLRPP